jgi:hypothetical protein
LAELLLDELDLPELLFELELDALFLEPLELPDLVGMGTLPSGGQNRRARARVPERR